MSKTTKIVLIILGVCGVLGLLCCGGLLGLGYFAGEESLKTAEEGRTFGQNATEQDCQEATWARAGKCTATDVMCPAKVESFFRGCLTTATETAGFCDGMPEGSGNAFEAGVNAATFANTTCEKLGSTRFRPRDPDLRPPQNVCVQVIQARAIHCLSL